MDKLTHLVSTLTELRQTCKHVIQRSVDLAKDLGLHSRDSSFYADVEEEDKEMVVEYIQELSLGFTTDSIRVLDELNMFCEFVVTNEPIEDTKAPFLSSVWCGDEYGDEGVAGFLALLKEVKRQERCITERFLRKKMSDKLGY